MLRHPSILFSRSMPVCLLLTSSSCVIAFTVLLLEIGLPGHVDLVLTKIAADRQMRDRFRSFYDWTVTTKLHGISDMGQLAFYSMGKANGHIVPEEVPTIEN